MVERRTPLQILILIVLIVIAVSVVVLAKGYWENLEQQRVEREDNKIRSLIRQYRYLGREIKDIDDSIRWKETTGASIFGPIEELQARKEKLKKEQEEIVEDITAKTKNDTKRLQRLIREVEVEGK